MHEQATRTHQAHRTGSTTRRRSLRRLTIVVAVLLATALTACGGPSDSDPSASGTPPDTLEQSSSEAAPYDQGQYSDEAGTGSESHETQISGHAYDSQGNLLAGVKIYIYILPRSPGSLYRTETGADGSYSYPVPEGVYLVQAQIDDPDPNLIVDLEPQQTNEEGVAAFSVPPSPVVDFWLP